MNRFKSVTFWSIFWIVINILLWYPSLNSRSPITPFLAFSRFVFGICALTYFYNIIPEIHQTVCFKYRVIKSVYTHQAQFLNLTGWHPVDVIYDTELVTTDYGTKTQHTVSPRTYMKEDDAWRAIEVHKNKMKKLRRDFHQKKLVGPWL